MTNMTPIDEKGAIPVDTKLAPAMARAAKWNLPPHLRNPELEKIKGQQQEGQSLQL